MESCCKTVFYCKLPLLGASKRNLLPSKIFCLSQKPFVWNINMLAAACDGVCRWSHTPSKDSSWECFRRLQEANGPPETHSSYLCLVFPEPQMGPLGRTGHIWQHNYPTTPQGPHGSWRHYAWERTEKYPWDLTSVLHPALERDRLEASYILK